MMPKIHHSLAALAIALSVGSTAVHAEPVNPLSESRVYDPETLLEEHHWNDLIDSNEALRIQLENTMLKLLVRLMELNMQNLDKELAQCEKPQTTR